MADLEAIGEHGFQDDDHHGHLELVVQTERGIDAAESAGWNATVHVVGADGADIDRDTVSGRHSGRGTAAVVLTCGARTGCSHYIWGAGATVLCGSGTRSRTKCMCYRRRREGVGEGVHVDDEGRGGGGEGGYGRKGEDCVAIRGNETIPDHGGVIIVRGCRGYRDCN